MIILILNFIIPDPIPIIDELISIPVLAVLGIKLINLIVGYKQKQRDIHSAVFRDNETIEDGEIIR